ncbi:MAG: TonB-dependent receptor plug domain-containing protein, partial [Bacteroidia bacterium]|nr:TonB-dependent receptor plug domain-containing protein [Bacteroidia bacterium]
MKKSFILLMLIVVACLHQGGNVLNAQIDKCPHPIDTVVVTAQYAPGSVENAVHKVKVIGQEKIESMGAQNLRDVLSNEMNIRLSQDNILGSNMSIQGISGQNVKIMVDGVPVSGRLNGSIDLSQINLYNVERIEIVDGPLSVNYGTDALAGTVNIITKKGQARKFSFSNELYYESIGQYNANARLGLRKGRTVLALSGGRNFFDGWRNNDPLFYYNLNPVADSTRHADWKPK